MWMITYLCWDQKLKLNFPWNRWVFFWISPIFQFCLFPFHPFYFFSLSTVWEIYCTWPFMDMMEYMLQLFLTTVRIHCRDLFFFSCKPHGGSLDEQTEVRKWKYQPCAWSRVITVPIQEKAHHSYSSIRQTSTSKVPENSFWKVCIIHCHV